MKKKVTPQQILDSWKGYKEACENSVSFHKTRRGLITIKTELPPRLSDLLQNLNITRATWANYSSKPGYSEYFEITEYVAQCVHQLKWDCLVNGYGDTGKIIWDLKANYGVLKEKGDSKPSGELLFLNSNSQIYEKQNKKRSLSKSGS